MSNDLISREALLEAMEKRYRKIEKNEEFCTSNEFVGLAKGFNEIDLLIRNAPTAYDPDKVVEWLEESKMWTLPSYDEDGYCNDDSMEVVDLYDAIEIVKKGGINE